MTRQEVINAVDMICQYCANYPELEKKNNVRVNVQLAGGAPMGCTMAEFLHSVRNGWQVNYAWGLALDYERELAIMTGGRPRCRVAGFSSITSIAVEQ